MNRSDAHGYIIAGDRRCILVKVEGNFILTVYEDSMSQNDCATNNNLPVSYILNYSGAIFWHALKDCPNEKKLIEILASRYPDVSVSNIGPDIRLFLDKLDHLRLIEYSSNVLLLKRDSAFMLALSLKEEDIFSISDSQYEQFCIEPIIYPAYEYSAGTTPYPSPGGDNPPGIPVPPVDPCFLCPSCEC